MKRTVVVVGALLFGTGVVMADQQIAIEQDNLMRVLAKNMYSVIGKMRRGDIPYDQAAVDAAIDELESGVARVATVFTPNPKEDVKDASYGSSQKIWQNKADFDSRIPPVSEAIAAVKGKIRDLDGVSAAYKSIEDRCNNCHDTYRVKLK